MHLRLVEKPAPRTYAFPIITGIPVPAGAIPSRTETASDPAHQDLFDMLSASSEELYAGTAIEHFVALADFAVRRDDGAVPLANEFYATVKVREAFAAWQGARPETHGAVQMAITPRTGWEGIEDIDEPGLSLRFECVA